VSGSGWERGEAVRLREKRENQKGLFGLFLAGRRTNDREGGAAGGTSWERRTKSELVFIGKVLLGFQISPSTFPFLLFSSFFFVNFDFSYFFCIFESEQISKSTQCGKSMILKMMR